MTEVRYWGGAVDKKVSFADLKQTLLYFAKEMFGAVEIDGGPWCKIPEGKPGAGIIIKDAIADITLQQVLTRPDDFDVIATLNLNGDYLSDALAAQVKTPAPSEKKLTSKKSDVKKQSLDDAFADLED